MKISIWLKNLALTFTVLFFCLGLKAQNSSTLITIGSEKVSVQEFENVFKKNNSKVTSPPDEKSLNEYLDLYINFKLKVLEAKSLGMDTVAAFKKELDGYRKQLAAPYLTDKEVTDFLIKEAFDRSKIEIRASHILVNCKDDASPKDTLAAYNKIMSIRKRITEKKEDFGKVAFETSEDQSAKSNQGDLGYFSAFGMVYSFENACYQAKVGAVSMPFRTRFGYHILKVVDSRPSQGEIKVAQIVLRFTAQSTKEDSAKNAAKINEIYNKLVAGEKFDELAKQYSEDKGSAKYGGVLPMFGVGKMVPEFESKAFALKAIGDYSKPFLSSYGWHIVKLLERKSPPTFEDSKKDIKAKINRDSRADLNKQSFAAKLKREYQYKENQLPLKTFYKAVDSSLMNTTFKKGMATNPTEELFSIETKKYTIEDYANFLQQYQFSMIRDNMPKAKKEAFENFANKSLMEYEEARLDVKYPEFKLLMEEYRDGILLFELTDAKVWSAAVKDTTGLKNYYLQNKKNYMWSERLNAIIYTCANETIATEVRGLIKNKKISEDSLLRRVNKTNPLNVSIKKDKFEKGENSIIDNIEWKKGLTANAVINNTVVFVKVIERIPEVAKALNEIRGTVTADFQNSLEKQWIEELKKKYPIQVNMEVFNSLLKK